MRSRYAAFALGLGDYLVRTLAKDHADHQTPRDVLVRELSRARDRQRFLGLRILETSGEGDESDEGEVLFYARIFERGADRSFVELSRFVREDGAWRYADGRLVQAAHFAGSHDPRTFERLDRATFLAAFDAL